MRRNIMGNYLNLCPIAEFRYHYLHRAKLYGQQTKYLLESSGIGWIGAMAFSSAAWNVKVRDERLGWDGEARKRTFTHISVRTLWVASSH